MLKDYEKFVPKWIKPVSLIFSLISLGLIVANYLGFVSGYILGGWFFVGLAVSGAFLKQVNHLSDQTSKIQSTFEQFHKLILEIENQEFTSQLLSEKRNAVIGSSTKASKVLKEIRQTFGRIGPKE